MSTVHLHIVFGAFLVVGIGLIIFGACVTFSHKFVTKLRKGLWKPDPKSSFDKSLDYNYDRYTRGPVKVLQGAIFAALGIWYFGTIWGLF
jgi:hypothetical protein